MRDANRIDEFLEILGDAWKLDPDLRLGQLLVILARPANPVPELFYMEETDLRTRLLRFSDERRRNKQT